MGIRARPADAQNKYSLGKLLRINSDGSIPPDDPIPNSPIYALGLRNAFGIAFDKSGH
jgi:aldose sugar dehydrogenase